MVVWFLIHRPHQIIAITCLTIIRIAHLIIIPWARVVCLIYTPEARGLRVYISGERQVHMV